MRNKVISIMLVVLLTVATVSIVIDSDTDAVAAGNIRVQYYDGQNWAYEDVVAFDMYQAVTAAAGSDNLGYSLTFATGADHWYKEVDAGTYTYTEPNESYGTILTVNGSSSFSIFVYVTASDATSSSWQVAESAIGWYRPFTDYAATVHFADEDGTGIGSSAGSANIAIVVGTQTEMPTGSYSTVGFTPVTSYVYTFTLKDNTASVSPTVWPWVSYYDEDSEEWDSKQMTSSDLRTGDGITIRGYGSDAYLALKNALGISVDGQDTITRINYNEDGTTYLTYYSWIGYILGSGTQTEIINNNDGTTTSNYTYWASYTSSGAYLSYTLGYYSGIDGAPNSGLDFKLTYELSSWTY